MFTISFSTKLAPPIRAPLSDDLLIISYKFFELTDPPYKKEIVLIFLFLRKLMHNFLTSKIFSNVGVLPDPIDQIGS